MTQNQSDGALSDSDREALQRVITEALPDVRRALTVFSKKLGPRGPDRAGLPTVFDRADVESQVWLRVIRSSAKVLASDRPTGFICRIVQLEYLSRWQKWNGRTRHNRYESGLRTKQPVRFSEVIDGDGREVLTLYLTNDHPPTFREGRGIEASGSRAGNEALVA